MTTDELYAELCMHVHEQSNLVREEPQLGAIAVPWLVTVLGSWMLRNIRKRGCEQKDEIIAAIMKYADTYIENDTVLQMILAVIDTGVEALCPVNPTE